MKKLFLIFTLCLLSSSAWSHESASAEHREKIYVSPEQIVVGEDGIGVYNEFGEFLFRGKALSFDEKGLFIESTIPMRGPCGIHSPRCNFCDGCRVLYCPMKCKCDGN